MYAAIEIKPNISTLTKKSEFHRGLKQLQSVKKLSRQLPVLFTEGEVPEALHKIPTVMFSKDSQSAEKTFKYMESQINDRDISPEEIPDMIVVLNEYIIFHSMYIEKTLFGSWAGDATGETYMLLETKEETLVIFLLALYCFKPPEPSISDSFFIKEYLKKSNRLIPYVTIKKESLAAMRNAK